MSKKNKIVEYNQYFKNNSRTDPKRKTFYDLHVEKATMFSELSTPNQNLFYFLKNYQTLRKNTIGHSVKWTS
jgi:hypothetical protein